MRPPEPSDPAGLTLLDRQEEATVRRLEVEQAETKARLALLRAKFAEQSDLPHASHAASSKTPCDPHDPGDDRQYATRQPKPIVRPNIVRFRVLKSKADKLV